MNPLQGYPRSRRRSLPLLFIATSTARFALICRTSIIAPAVVVALVAKPSSSSSPSPPHSSSSHVARRSSRSSSSSSSSSSSLSSFIRYRQIDYPQPLLRHPSPPPPPPPSHLCCSSSTVDRRCGCRRAGLLRAPEELLCHCASPALIIDNIDSVCARHHHYIDSACARDCFAGAHHR